MSSRHSSDYDYFIHIADILIFLYLWIFKDAVIVCASFWYEQKEPCPMSGPILVNSHGPKAASVPGSR